ncbi:unnamed protein product [Sphagnum balticum]
MLKFRVVSKVNVYDCPTKSEFSDRDGMTVSKSHYEVEFDDKMSVQHVMIMPYSIDTYGDQKAPLKSRLYKLTEGKWRFVKEVPRIKEDTEENLLKRIANFLPFNSISLYTKINDKIYRWTVYKGIQGTLWWVKDPGKPGTRVNKDLVAIKSFGSENIDDPDFLPVLTPSNINEKLRTWLTML